MPKINIRIIAVGKIKEDFFKRGIKHYLLRLKPFCKVEIIEVRESKLAEKRNIKEEKALEEEALDIIKNIRGDAHLIPLAAEGKMMTSEEFAFYLERLLLEGRNKVDFIIGGPLGLAESLKKRGDLLLSFSAFTFPHRLVRLILLEQIYRCFKIIRGEPYHR